MTTKKTTVKASASAAPGAGVAVAAVSAPVFRDKRFTSRTLILPDGATAQVVAGRIMAMSDEQMAWLSANAEFERLPE